MVGGSAMNRQAELIERLRELLASEASLRELSMFGGRSFMVNNKIVACALKDGDLLARIDADRHDEFVQHSGAAQAEMGAGRSMGPGWIEISADEIEGASVLSFWVSSALDYNRAVAG